MRKFLFAACLGLALLAGLASDASLAQPAQCGRVANGASAAATTLVITGTAGQGIHLCGWDVTATAVGTWQIITGTGATCGTGTVNISAAHSLGAQNALSSSGATPGRYSAPQGNNICVIVTGTGPVQWTIYYTQF